MIAFLLGCTDLPIVPLHFDGPVAAAVLPPGVGGPFEVPVGFVANSRNGTIVPLDLKQGRLLTDDATASFLRTAALSTGRRRILQDVAIWAEDGTVTVWAADLGFGELLRVPYIIAIGDDGVPVEVSAAASAATFVDADESGDDAVLKGLDVRDGFTTTEDWYIEYDGARWWARGSRSGTQVNEPIPGEAYQSDHLEVLFELSGTATLGDRFEFRTDTGIDAFTLGGLPSALLTHDGRLYVTVLAADDGSSPARVFVLDARSGGYIGTVDLPDGVQPWRLAAGEDGRVFIADSRQAFVWVARFDQSFEPASVPLESIATAAPVIDVAVQDGRLWVAPTGLQRVDVYDIASGAWFDPNPVTAEVEGIDLGSPVAGLAASIDTVYLLRETTWGARPRVPTVAVSTQDGFVFELDATTGCAVVTARGPHGPNASIDSGDAATYAALDDHGPTSNSVLAADDATGEQIQTSACGGVARSETWLVTYDSALLSWSVEGTVSGVQLARAQDDVRYLSDDGAVSFIVQSGPLPPTDGDSFSFAVDRGILTLVGTDANGDGTVGTGDRSWEFPGRPTAFNFTVGPSGGGWDKVDRREFVMLPATNSDLVARIHLDSAQALVDWQ